MVPIRELSPQLRERLCQSKYRQPDATLRAVFDDLPTGHQVHDELQNLMHRYDDACTVQQALAWIDEAPAVQVGANNVRTDVWKVVCIAAPHWFKRPDFLTWLNGADPTRGDGTVIATWHRPGQPPTEFSDIFTTYDHGEGCDQPVGDQDRPELPQPIWDEICRICQAKGIEAAIVWIQNC